MSSSGSLDSRKKIILASASPRRKELLARTGIAFDIQEAEFEEDLGLDMPPHDLAVYLSEGKAASVAQQNPDAIVIAADTFIVLDGEILGKPGSKEDAARMLQALGGRTHTVITGYTVMDTASGRAVSRSVETQVRFKDLSDEEISSYVATGEPMDKAGAYAIQERGAALVEGVEGDYDNVVGLPLKDVIETLREFGIETEDGK